MKHADIQKLHEAGLISEEQRRKIIKHFQLKEEGGKFLAIISVVGALLIVGGIILLISANWEEIPRGVKIAAGLLLMLGARGGGWWLREVQGKYRKSGEALHLVGSGLFLGNIALIGQIYHLSSREPNAFLLWWLGIAALPWLLRSKAQHVLLLLAFGIWLSLETSQRDSWIYFADNQFQLVVLALLGLIYLGAGYRLRGTKSSDFAEPTEKLGLLAFLVFSYPLTWEDIFRGPNLETSFAWILPALCVIALFSIVPGVMKLSGVTRQWRWTWLAALAGVIALLAGAVYLAPLWANNYYDRHNFGYHWIATVVLFVFCLLQIQVGIQERSEFMLNLGVIFIVLDIIATYLGLFGSMARTGLMFLISGVFLIAFGIYMEKKRRALMKQIKSPPEGLRPEAAPI
jgi:uncharacterized membrane protein